MTKKNLLGAVTMTALATILSCDADSSANGDNLDADCPIGTFRPVGLEECVFPADDQFGTPLGVSDNRCATGQPARPPACVSDLDGRAYFSLTKACAPGYRFAVGSCLRDGGNMGTSGFGFVGEAGTTGAAGTAAAGTGFAGTGVAGTSAAGGGTTGAAGDNPGSAGTFITVDAGGDVTSQ